MNVLNIPDNWRHVEKDGNPAEGMYLALFNEDDCLIIDMLAYMPDEEYHEYFIITGWYNRAYSKKKVVAYYPDNLDVKSLKEVRGRFKEDVE